jgi:DNA-binding response OmpR family regulator
VPVWLYSENDTKRRFWLQKVHISWHSICSKSHNGKPPLPMNIAIQGRNDALPILLVDDDRKLCELMTASLADSGFAITSAHSGVEALARFSEQQWHAVLLDLMLPEMDGFELLRRIRETSDVPVLMLTARGEDHNCIHGLNLGADDYLQKTLSPSQIVARIKAVARRANRSLSTDSDTIEIGPLRIHPTARMVTFEGQQIFLTSIELLVLTSLASVKGHVKKRADLLQEICGREYQDFDRSIDVHISSLRRKLNDDPRKPRFIRTIRSVGYSLLDQNE